MVQIAAATVDLSANSAAFAADMGKANRALRSNTVKMNRGLGRLDRAFGSVKRSVGGMVKGMFSFRAAMGAVAAAAGIGFLVKKSIDLADSIVKTADSIGISTDALQEWRKVADLSGVETAQFDKSLKFLSKTMGELKTRTDSELVTALKNYNPVLLETLRNVNSFEEALDLSIKALAEETDAFKRSALAKSLFGRAGQANIIISRDGTAAVAAMLARVRELGLVIEEKLLRNAEDAKDRLSDLGDVLKITVTAAVLEHAKAIEELAIRLTAAIPKMKAWVIGFGEWIGLLEQTPARRLAEIREEVAELQKQLETPIFLQPLGGAIFEREVPAAARLNELLKEQQQILRENRRISDVRVASRASLAPPGARATIQAEAKAAAEEAAKIADALADARKEALRLVEDTRLPLERFQDEMAKINELAGQFPDILTPEKIKRLASKAVEDFRRLTDAGTDSFDRLKDAAAQAFDTMKAEAESAFAGMKSAAESIFRAVQTPLERFQADLAEAFTVFQAGALPPDIFIRRIAQLRESLAATTGTPAPKVQVPFRLPFGAEAPAGITSERFAPRLERGAFPAAARAEAPSIVSVSVPIEVSADVAVGVRSVVNQMVPQISRTIEANVLDALRRDARGAAVTQAVRT